MSARGISLNPGVTATSIHQDGKNQVDVALSDGDQLILQGNNLHAKDVVAMLGVSTHVDNGNHYGFDHSNHCGYACTNLRRRSQNMTACRWKRSRSISVTVMST
jgi:hypothetical protein